MESTIVIKVKYGKTLRRFNARVNEAGKLELRLFGLRDKILFLFKLSPKADLTLTYLDEDGDSVTLADDEDLHDVMRQSLNPLRITVKVNAEKGSNSSLRSNGDCTSIRSSPKASHPLPNLNTTVSEISKTVTEAIEEALPNMSRETLTAAVSSHPHLLELRQRLSKMMQSLKITDSQKGTDSGTQPDDLEIAKPAYDERTSDFGRWWHQAKKVTFSNTVNQPLRCEENMGLRFSNLGKNASFAPKPSSVELNADHSSGQKEEVNKCGERNLNTEGSKPDWEKIKVVASSVLGTDDKEVKKAGVGWNSNGAADSPLFSNTFWNPKTSAGISNQNVKGLPVANDSASPYNFGPRVHPFKRICSQGGVASIFHRGVCCDGCGVHPITGPRFKSKVKDDYDLCSICFAEMGSEAEYIRLERPMAPIPYRHLHPLKSAKVNPPSSLPKSLTGGVKPNPPKLDSRFVIDVNVSDGTMMAPSTPFTKIWRMRNSGNLVWPHGTHLVWIGGEMLSASISAGLQIPVDGIAVGNELEMAVDFMAPKLPGRYISYWRMASPSGQKFGQRIWVLIQVDALRKDSTFNDNQGLNLNRPLEIIGNDKAFSKIVDAQLPLGEMSKRATDLVELLVVPLPTKDQDLDFPTNDNLLVNGTPAPQEVCPITVPYPAMDSYAVTNQTEPSQAPPPTPIVVDSLPQASDDKDNFEQNLLRELEEMGFKQVDLNKEILRVNEYNLEQSVDDLCGVSEWDPILEELQEMGFCDNEVNKKLLKKNNGSIKGVVMDLITGDKV